MRLTWTSWIRLIIKLDLIQKSHQKNFLVLLQAFSHFCFYWFTNYSEKITTLIYSHLSRCSNAFNRDRKQCDLLHWRHNLFLETNASELVIVVTLNQAGMRLAVYSISLNASNKKQPAMEKTTEKLHNCHRFTRTK